MPDKCVWVRACMYARWGAFGVFARVCVCAARTILGLHAVLARVSLIMYFGEPRYLLYVQGESEERDGVREARQA